MKKTIQLTAIENLISTYYITPYFNTLLNIPLSFKKKKFKITSNIKKEGKTIICVTHDEKMAKSADRIIDLKKERGSEK